MASHLLLMWLIVIVGLGLGTGGGGGRDAFDSLLVAGSRCEVMRKGT